MSENLEELSDEYKIIVRDLMKVYKRGQKEVIALRGIDFEVNAGEFLSIIGPSGSGKSTLLKMLGALDKPTAGAIIYDGHSVTTLDDRRSMLYRRQKVGFVWQIGNLVPGLNALKNVILPMKLAGAPSRQSNERALMLLEKLGLSSRIDNPELLLGDEITGELDSETTEIVMEALKNTNKEFGTTVINVTHNPKVAEYADRVLRIRDGLIEGQKHILYGDITEIDAKGRMVIPETVRRLAGLGKRVVLRATSDGLLISPLDTSGKNDNNNNDTATN